MTEELAGFPKPGDIFEERYRIENLIGSGGFAKVYRATQTDLGRDVALKIMLPEEVLRNVLDDSSGSGGHKISERFMQEARVVAQLRDPHTVTMHDHGRSENGLLYMVFEFIDGMPLSKLVRAEGALDSRRVAKIMRQTLSSLQEAHAMGMLHRDIKPGNIMVYEHVGRPDQVKVLDFGIAKVVGKRVNADLKDDLTTNGALLGTPRYMSPEQIRGQDLTPASDLYSLGLVAFEMLTGSKAIDSNSSVIVIGAQLDPRSFAVPNQPHIAPNLRMIINRMLSKELEHRYKTVDEVLEDLNRLDTGAFPAQLPMGSQSGQFQAPEVPDISDSLEPLQVAEIEDASARARRNRGLLFAGGGIALLLAVIVVMLSVGDDTPTEPPPGDSPPVAVNEPPAVAPADPPDEVVKVEKADEPKEKTIEAPAVPEEMVIATSPPGLEVFVNGESAGKSPVKVPTAGVKFPAKIRAETESGHDRMTIVDNALEAVELDLSMFAAAEKTNKKPTVRKKSGGTGKSGGSSKGDDRKSGGGAQVDSNDKSGDKADDKKSGGLTLPPLDY